ncbi:unnamed protein product [Rodentolepis nana]|uniref:cytochrome-c oxidase n=1 Tax=Rodentolepis nana TaxID=102285 RepID=A0A0R3TB36_RODNA|nr:unnamed protein product [Rodentolepis nana]
MRAMVAPCFNSFNYGDRKWFYLSCIKVFFVIVVYTLLYVISGRIMYDSEKQIVEIPTIVVLTLCILKVKFITNDLDSFSSETIKIVGHQWYWEYDTSQGSFESFVQCDKFIVDKPLRLIRGLPYHFIVTSADVIHSFHIPSLNLKMDAIPGRLNNLFFCPELYGTYIGYCAELCGVNHGIMPIVVEVVDNYCNEHKV